MTLFLDGWDDAEGVGNDFDADLSAFEILIGFYDLSMAYEGYAWVLCRDAAGQLYEVNGSHCSCFGLEEQWDPDPTSWDYLCSENFPHRDHPEIMAEVRRLAGRAVE